MLKDVKSYIAQFPAETQVLLFELREIILEVAPDATECMKYKLPAYTLQGPLAYFAAYKSHIGLYPTPSPIVAFESELTNFKFSKGAIQFSMTEKLPKDLIKRILKYRLKELVEQ